MIVEKGRYYLYRHIRKDKNEPFYIGVGTKKKGNGQVEIYIRSHTRYGRNRLWKSIVNKTDYDIEVIMESDDRDFLLRKESEFIVMYGRIDIGTGTLSNFTDGGEGGSNKSREQLDLELETRKKNGSYQRNKNRFQKWVNDNLLGKPSIRRKGAYLYKSDGTFYKAFDSMTDCAKFVDISRSLVCRLCRDKVINFRYIYSDIFYGDSIPLSVVKKQYRCEEVRLVKMSRVWEMLEIYKTTKSAGIANGFNYKNMDFIINRKNKYRQHNWRYINNANNNI